jgi:hypothetical protein
MHPCTGNSYDVGVSMRVILILVLAGIASAASLLFPPVRDGVRLAKKGAWDPAQHELFLERHDAGRSLPGPGAHELLRGEVLFVDELEDTRLTTAWGRPFHRGAAEVEGALWPAYRGSFVFKQVAVAVQIVILLLAGTMVCLARSLERRRVGPPHAAVRTADQTWWSKWRRGMAVALGLLLLAGTVFGFARLATDWVLLGVLLLTALVLALPGAIGVVAGSVLAVVQWARARARTTVA